MTLKDWDATVGDSEVETEVIMTSLETTCLVRTSKKYNPTSVSSYNNTSIECTERIDLTGRGQYEICRTSKEF